jgi:hypothetical protein
MWYDRFGLSGACTARLSPNQSVAREANNFWSISERMNMAENTSATERVQASFRQLSASATSLNAASDVLRETISELETAFKELNLGVSAWVPIAKGHDSSAEIYWSRDLGYSRVGKVWCIALRYVEGHESAPEDEEQEVWAFNDAPRWMRGQGVSKLPELLEALIKQADETAKNFRMRAGEAKALVEAIKGLTVEQPKESPRK